MSCQEIRIILDGITNLLWDISMDIVCLSFSSFPYSEVCQVWMAKTIFLCEKEEKAVSPTQLNSDRL